MCFWIVFLNLLQLFFKVFNKLLRRYKYLERSFEDALKKVSAYLTRLITAFAVVLALQFFFTFSGSSIWIVAIQQVMFIHQDSIESKLLWIEDNIFILLQILYFMKGFQDDEKQKLAIITGIFLGNGFCSAKVLSSLFEEHLVKDGKTWLILYLGLFLYQKIICWKVNLFFFFWKGVSKHRNFLNVH